MDALIEFLLTVADDAHKAHLATRSYAEHQALGAFYEGIRADADPLFEALIGMGNTPTPNDESPAAVLKERYAELQSMRGICDGNPAAENLFDSVSAHFLSAIYKLDRLA
jgi:Family of unknown function (DUF5856)